MRIPGPTKPAYLDNTCFNRVKKSARMRDGGSGLAVLDTDVDEVIDPRGLPVWKTFVMLMCSGDILAQLPGGEIHDI